LDFVFMTAVLTIQNLGKCFRVQTSGGARSAYGYRTLRDDLSDWAKSWFRRGEAAALMHHAAHRPQSFIDHRRC
jgi:hypothetical protein